VNLGWIWTQNLRPLLDVLGWLTDFKIDESDWAAISTGIVGTDSERGPWFDFPLGETTVLLALEPGAGEMITLRIEGTSAAVTPKLELASDIMRAFDVRGHD
jgi:hypothetical protein